jgi:hypothetical protein
MSAHNLTPKIVLDLKNRFGSLCSEFSCWLEMLAQESLRQQLYAIADGGKR